MEELYSESKRIAEGERTRCRVNAAVKAHYDTGIRAAVIDIDLVCSCDGYHAAERLMFTPKTDFPQSLESAVVRKAITSFDAWCEQKKGEANAHASGAEIAAAPVNEVPAPGQPAAVPTRAELEAVLANPPHGVCVCEVIQKLDHLRHFKGCPLRKPLPAGHPYADPPVEVEPPPATAVAARRQPADDDIPW